MIEQYIDRICSTLQDRLDESGGIAVHALRPLLPADALAWCKADATEQLMSEWEGKGPTSRIFNANPENPRVVRAAVSSLVPFFVYEGPSAMAAVRGALTFAAHYACKPRETLAHQVFRDAPTVTGDMLKIRLSAVVEYRYLPSLLARNLGSRQQIFREQFEDSAAAIDDAAMRQHNPEEFARLMLPIARWSALAGGDPQGVPVDALLDFLADKRLQVLRDYVASIARIRSRTSMDFQEIATLVRDIEVRDLTHLKGVPAPSTPASGDEVLPAQAPEPDIAPGMETSIETQTQPDFPTEMLPSQQPEEIQPIETEILSGVASTPSAEPEHEPVEPVGPAAFPPRTFAPEMRASLSNSLFHGNVAYFDVTVNELSHLQNWREAATYLTDLLEINRLNPYAADVMQFTDAIRRWFVRDEEETPS